MSGPRYLRIVEDLRAELRRGEPPVGARFPTDFELCRRFGVSRHTVREALRRLEAAGLIERRRRLGSVVVRSEPERRFTNSIETLEELNAYARETRLEPLEQGEVEADEALAEQLGTAAGTRWAWLRARRYAPDDARPLCLLDLYLRSDLAPVLQHVGADDRAIYQRIRDLAGVEIVACHQEIRADLLDAAQARLLEARAKAACLTITRRYADADGALLEVA
ncbi:MAG: GntR family transcriptional regulator, partial [Pseudomonadota bacterium]